MFKKIFTGYLLVGLFALMLFLSVPTSSIDSAARKSRLNSNDNVSTFDTISNDFNYNDVLSNIYFTSFSYNTNKRYGSAFILEFTPFLDSNDIIFYNFILSVNSTYYLSYTDFSSYNLVGSYSFDIYDFDFDFTTLKLSSSTITLMNDNNYYFNFDFTFIDVLNNSFTISINSPNFSNINSLVDFINIGLSNVSDSIDSLRFDNRFSNGEFFNYKGFTFSFYHSSLAIKGVYDIYSYYLYENSYNDGYDDGYENGITDGYNDGYDFGYEKGENLGYINGYDEGYGVGYDEGYGTGLLNNTSNVITPANIDLIYFNFHYPESQLYLQGEDLTNFLNLTFSNGAFNLKPYMSTLYNYVKNNENIPDMAAMEQFEIVFNFKFNIDSKNIDLVVSNIESLEFFDVSKSYTYNVLDYSLSNPSVDYNFKLDLENLSIFSISFTTNLNFNYDSSHDFINENVVPVIRNNFISQYDSGYNKGYSIGVIESKDKINELNEEIKQQDKDIAYLNDRLNSLTNGDNFTLANLFWSIGAVPFETIKSIWNFEFLGVNLTQFFTGLITCLLLIYLIKKLFFK